MPTTSPSSSRDSSGRMERLRLSEAFLPTACTAAVFSGETHHLELNQIPLPMLGAGEILVKVTACTLCGSDLHSVEGRRKVPVPTILGHEIVGQIAAIGGDFTPADLANAPLHVGDLVTWAVVANCGKCFYCERDLPQKCLHSVKYGHEAFRPGKELLGGLAEYCLLVPGTAIIKLPPHLPTSVACPASCATSTIAAVLEAAQPLKGRSICILGAGMLGLTACAMSRSLGATHVICVDPQPYRRELALNFGATHTSDSMQLAETLRSAGLPHGVDAVAELSGNNAAFESVWPLVRLGGTIVLAGSVFPSPAIGMALEQLVRRQITMRGVHNYGPRHLRTAIEFLASEHQNYPFESLVKQWFPLEQISEAMTAGKEPSAIRIGITMTQK
ncbi:zinc-binding dehydrogenase [Planctopirus hydrillae]|uniref:alcohol dehydrogenase n=1 Tax=Planctopirus hydrillae TaxID=1841610 RepID=A0A1C3EHL4_9PLAN|nr:zinc-binding dehydrogenase [Planctopirus hydrillae]ODA32735.1 alcohol dehydrogenase [Planctopirus hydrillae]